MVTIDDFAGEGAKPKTGMVFTPDSNLSVAGLVRALNVMGVLDSPHPDQDKLRQYPELWRHFSKCQWRDGQLAIHTGDHA